MNHRLSSQNKSIQIIKLICVLIVLPVIIGFILGLISEITKLEGLFKTAFYWGVAGYLLFHIFLAEPVKFYKNTQKFIKIIFGFFSPLFKMAYYLIPFWIIVIIGFFVLFCKIFKFDNLYPVFFFLSGFLFTMHIVMVTKILKVDELRKIIDYLFIIFIVVIINIFFLSFNLKLYAQDFSVVTVGKEGLTLGIGLAKSVWDQLFIPEVSG